MNPAPPVTNILVNILSELLWSDIRLIWQIESIHRPSRRMFSAEHFIFSVALFRSFTARHLFIRSRTDT